MAWLIGYGATGSMTVSMANGWTNLWPSGRNDPDPGSIKFNGRYHLGIYTEFYQGCDWDEVRYKIGQINGLRNDRLYPYEVIRLPEVN